MALASELWLGLEADMGSVHPWVGSEIFAYEMGWVGYSCQKLIIFFTTIIIPLSKSLTVIYHHKNFIQRMLYSNAY